MQLLRLHPTREELPAEFATLAGRTERCSNGKKVTAAVTRCGYRRREDSEGCLRCWGRSTRVQARLRGRAEGDPKHSEPHDRLRGAINPQPPLGESRQNGERP